MVSKDQPETIFTVRIDGLVLDEETAERLEGSIRRVVLGEFADLDMADSLRIGKPPVVGSGGTTRGIVIKPSEM
ncbi:hypothetical protein [Nocardia sp. NPDC003345]